MNFNFPKYLNKIKNNLKFQVTDAKNVIVVVSRWYGGIHLGSDRFRHINNAAQQVLTAANLINKHHLSCKK